MKSLSLNKPATIATINLAVDKAPLCVSNELVRGASGAKSSPVRRHEEDGGTNCLG